MDWTQVLTIVGANLGTTIAMFLWCRHEAGEDRKIVADDRKDILNLIRAVQSEMQDFHGRLCAIEERNKK